MCSPSHEHCTISEKNRKKILKQRFVYTFTKSHKEKHNDIIEYWMNNIDDYFKDRKLIYDKERIDDIDGYPEAIGNCAAIVIYYI